MAIINIEKHHHHRPLGQWPPGQRQGIACWVACKAQEARNCKEVPVDPSLLAFQQLVNGSPDLKKLANMMFYESSKKYQYDPNGRSAIKDFNEFIAVVNLIIKQGPPFCNTGKPSTAMGLLGFPINAVLDWPMGTVSGYEFWLHPDVNASFKDVLNTWACLLGSPDSRGCLRDWLSPLARDLLATAANHRQTSYTFEQIFKCDPTDTFYGFDSWDAFFTREFREGIRPVEAPESAPFDPNYPDPTRVIVNACESAPLQVDSDVKMREMFWLKGQPYSLDRMLNGHALTPQFVGGTVYQAFLSAKSYHRWHAPVSGRVVGIEHVPGTYYSENCFEGLSGDPDPAAPNYSQPYISAVATRGIIYIQARDPRIGLMAIVFIGMAEISSCHFIVGVNDVIEKGQQIGMFHFGGSSHCMLFRPGVNLRFLGKQPPWDMDHEENNQVNSALAVVE